MDDLALEKNFELLLYNFLSIKSLVFKRPVDFWIKDLSNLDLSISPFKLTICMFNSSFSCEINEISVSEMSLFLTIYI